MVFLILWESVWVDVKMASVEWSKSAVGVLGLNADFGNTLKTILCCGQKWLSGYLQTHQLSGSQVAGDEGLSSAPLQNAGLAHVWISLAPSRNLHTLLPQSWARGCCCPFPKITSPCMGRPQKPNSFLATRQKQSLFHHRKGENILTNACVLDGWQSCHGKEAAAPFGDGRWGAGSGNFWALLAAQVWHQATNPPLLALKHKQIDTECSVAAPGFLWNKFGYSETWACWRGCTTHIHLHN